jgi:hypothetical protein
MTELGVSRGGKLPLEEYLVVWLGLVGGAVGLTVPVGVARTLIGIDGMSIEGEV